MFPGYERCLPGDSLQDKHIAKLFSNSSMLEQIQHTVHFWAYIFGLCDVADHEVCRFKIYSPAFTVELPRTHHSMNLNEEDSKHEESIRRRPHPRHTTVTIAHSFSTRIYSQTYFAPQIACHASGAQRPKAGNFAICSLLFIFGTRWSQHSLCSPCSCSKSVPTPTVVWSCLVFPTTCNQSSSARSNSGGTPTPFTPCSQGSTAHCNPVPGV